MQRESVSSSNIASIGYDARALILEIEFHNGGVYQYYEVPNTVYESLMTAGSHGSYLAQNVKGHYRYRQIN